MKMAKFGRILIGYGIAISVGGLLANYVFNVEKMGQWIPIAFYIMAGLGFLSALRVIDSKVYQIFWKVFVVLYLTLNILLNLVSLKETIQRIFG